MNNGTVLKDLLPSPETITDYKDMERLSLVRINELLKDPDKDEDGAKMEIAKLSDKLLKTVNNFRSHMRSEMSLSLKMFKDVSENKIELKAYIEASYPNSLSKKK